MSLGVRWCGYGLIAAHSGISTWISFHEQKTSFCLALQNYKLWTKINFDSDNSLHGTSKWSVSQKKNGPLQIKKAYSGQVPHPYAQNVFNRNLRFKKINSARPEWIDFEIMQIVCSFANILSVKTCVVSITVQRNL